MAAHHLSLQRFPYFCACAFNLECFARAATEDFRRINLHHAENNQRQRHSRIWASSWTDKQTYFSSSCYIYIYILLGSNRLAPRVVKKFAMRIPEKVVRQRLIIYSRPFKHYRMETCRLTWRESIHSRTYLPKQCRKQPSPSPILVYRTALHRAYFRGEQLTPIVAF